MGCLQSVEPSKGSNFPEIFLPPDLREANDHLQIDAQFAASFADYVKSGAWLDRMTRYVSALHSVPLEEVNHNGSSPFLSAYYSYGLPTAKLPDGDHVENSVSMSTNANSSKSSKKAEVLPWLESYTSIESCNSFDKDQLCWILLSITYGVYVSSSSGQRYIQHRTMLNPRSNEDDSGASGYYSVEAGMVVSGESRRAQELLLSCAAHFDEPVMMEQIAKNWTDSVSSTFNDYPLAISVVSTIKAGGLFVYVNRAFNKLFEYADGQVLNEPLSILDGTGTEHSQKHALLLALHSTETKKLWITRYTRNNRVVLDAVAVKAVGTYALCVHFHARRGAHTAPLQKVDDLLLLMSYLVTPPPSPAPVSWFGPLHVPAINTALGLRRSLHPSPSSVRSRASSSETGDRRNSNSSGLVSPTSIRRFSAGRSQRSRASSSPSSRVIGSDGLDSLPEKVVVDESAIAGNALHT